jgi:6-bladed beta-propeller
MNVEILGNEIMKKNSSHKAFFIFIVLIISLVITISFVNMLNNDKTINGLLKPARQATTHRKWIDVSLDTVYIKKYLPPIIYTPLKAKVDKMQNLYVLDVQLKSVLKFSQNGNFIRGFGYGKGEGPGEFMNPRDFDIDSEGNVYISDASRIAITVFDSTGKLKKIIKPKNCGVLDQFRVFGRGNYFIRDLSVGNFFKIYNTSGDLIKSFGGNFLIKQNSYALPIGVLLCKGHDKIYGVFDNAGYMFAYDTTGKMIFYNETMDRISFPKFTFIGDKNSSSIYLGDAPVVNWDLSYSTNEQKRDIIYIHPGYTSRKMRVLIIDAYLAKNGKYLYSFKVTRPSDKYGITSFIIHGENLYLVGEGEKTLLIKYKFKTKEI